jgi:L-ascorbate metabolism protein UlaG (beta-lactamase superfamily)
MRADIVTVSKNTSDHNYVRGVKSGYKLLTGPGEYEIAGVFVTGLELRAGSGKQLVSKPRSTVFVFEFEDITVCHLGDLDYVPTQAQVEALSTMDVLLVPVGGGESLNAVRASEVASLLEPRIVIPMCRQVKGSTLELDPVNKFLREIGLEKVTTQESLKVSRSMLPEETQVVLLDIHGQEE